MIEHAIQWTFYQDRNTQWQWRKLVSNKVVAVSSDGFTSRKECINSAVQRGYVAPPKTTPSKKQQTSNENILASIPGLASHTKHR